MGWGGGVFPLWAFIYRVVGRVNWTENGKVTSGIWRRIEMQYFLEVMMRMHAVYGFLVGQMTHQMKADNPGNPDIYFCETFSFILALF